jgi:predicted HTH transcriptional regulator
MSPRLRELLRSGESDTLDYKHEIASPAKIAKTIVSFANHHGGTVLVGVGDDATIKGVNADEEQFMLTEATTRFCRPVLTPEIHEHVVGRKTVLEVHIPEGDQKPYCALDADGKWWAYVRVKDSTKLASTVELEVLKRRSRDHETRIRYSENEKALLEYLSGHERITLDEFRDLAKIPRRTARKVLVNLIAIGCIALHHEASGEYYALT